MSRTTTQVIVMVMWRESTRLSALWPWGRLSLELNWVPEIFPVGKGGRCVELTNLPPPCADSFKILGPGPPGTLMTCPGLYRDCFTFTFCLVGCGLVACYKLCWSSEGTECLRLQPFYFDDRGSRFLQVVGTFLIDCTASHLRIHVSALSQQW
jgi:hypothetical protein